MFVFKHIIIICSREIKAIVKFIVISVFHLKGPLNNTPDNNITSVFNAVALNKSMEWNKVYNNKNN